MPEPSWQFIGQVGEDGYKWVYNYLTNNWFRAGWADLAVQFYSLPEYNKNGDENYFVAKVPIAHQDPGWDGDVNGKTCDMEDADKGWGPLNEHAKVGIDWNPFDDYSSSDLSKYKPSSAAGGNYKYSATVSASPAGPSAGVGVSYDPAVIDRRTPERTNDKVVWDWQFNHTDWSPFDTEAQYQDTTLAAASSCQLNGDPVDTYLAEIRYDATWQAKVEDLHWDTFTKSLKKWVERVDLNSQS